MSCATLTQHLLGDEEGLGPCQALGVRGRVSWSAPSKAGVPVSVEQEASSPQTGAQSICAAGESDHWCTFAAAFGELGGEGGGPPHPPTAAVLSPPVVGELSRPG